ncbi:endolytic transglycosylase MltG [Candidatus Jorgensenbacteria bacterium]|nr:endolytic transglycosylase MltG [Candidatus Jorgensenbacteria bacterium]
MLFFIIIIAYFFYGLQPAAWSGGSSTSDEASIQFRIIRGEGFRDIGARLSQTKLLKSIAVFKFYSLLTGRAQRFQPGIYQLSDTMSVPEIVRILTAGGKNEVTVTIPEGTTVKDIDAILAVYGIIEKGELNSFRPDELASEYQFLTGVHSFEGFLFPDTYRFNLNSSVEKIVRVFLDTFTVKSWPELESKKDWYDFLILASYLEREVPEFNDRQIVAGIMFKRLKLGIPLQIDATLSYAKCDGELMECPTLLVGREDLTIASPYNTYQRLGWTPTPISNPGQAAIKAAVTPKTSPYLFYLSASKTKETLFSKTLEEHNIKRAKYL